MKAQENTKNDSSLGHGLIQVGSIIAFPNHWQRPAATEEFAFNAIIDNSKKINFQYFGFAWATLIDGLKTRSSKTKDILLALEWACRSVEKGHRRCTVAQHIHALKYIEIYKAAGITDLFWSHATTQDIEISSIKIHPFPLYPAQAPYYFADTPETINKKYLANFIGAYNPSIYLTNVRSIIFGDAGTSDDLLIIQRDRWHFDRTVYEEQILEKNATHEQLNTEELMKKEYLDAMRQSWFTLCPSGSGPNSIRLFECLSLGSIPIILTKELRLAGDQDLWKKAALIEEDSEGGYRRALNKARKMSKVKRHEKLRAGYNLFQILNSKSYHQLIFNLMGE